MMTQAHYLLMMAEDAHARGELLNEKIRRECTAHAEQLAEESAMVNRAKEIMDAQIARWARYLPQQNAGQVAAQGQAAQPPLPRIVKQQQATG